MLGGDFNIKRIKIWPSLFNAVINSLDLKELELSGRKFTWANSLIDPTFERLDRVLVSIEWELQFPRTTVQALTREISSDHTPLLLSFGDTTVTPPMFKFELGWLTRDDFHEVVENIWREENRGVSSIERWQNKIRRLRQFLSGWAKNKSGHYKKEKKELISKLRCWIRKQKMRHSFSGRFT